jgi:hypothetical protein
MKMISAKRVENVTIKSFSRLKTDVRLIARWVAWNKRDHKLMSERIAELEQKQGAPKPRKYVGSVKARTLHAPNCMHVKNIKQSNKAYFDHIKEAKEEGYRACSCTA